MPDADLPRAAEMIAAAAYFNAGQDCTAATRVIAHSSVHDELADLLVKAARARWPGPPTTRRRSTGRSTTRATSPRSRRSSPSLPDHATVRTGGSRHGEAGFFFAPTVVTGVRQDDRIVQEEVFGPVLTVQSFDDEADAVAMANGVPYGLAASVWTRDVGVADRLTRELDFGCVWVNTHIPFVSEMPHGGFGASGYGKDLSGYGFDDYTRIKHVMTAHY